MFSKMFNYFASNSKTHLDNTQESAINCGQHSAEAASYAVKTLPQILLGLITFKEISGSVMTGYAFGFALPEFAKVIVKSLASTIFFHPTASMVCSVAVTVAANSENVVECIKNTAHALYDAGSTVYEGTLCAVNGAAAAATFVYDNVYSTDVQLSGNAIEAVL